MSPVRYDRTFIYQKAAFFIVTAVDTSNLSDGVYEDRCGE
jgi:hypothetical protein